MIIARELISRSKFWKKHNPVTGNQVHAPPVDYRIQGTWYHYLLHRYATWTCTFGEQAKMVVVYMHKGKL